MRKVAKLVGLLWIAALTACNMPVNPSPGPFPMPNQTMTALFSTPLPSPIVTSRPGQATATPPAPPSPFPTFTTTGTAAPTQPATAQPQPTATPAAPTQLPPTATKLPPSATPDLSRRTVTSVTAAYLAVKPKIDGDWNDLPDKEYPAEIVVYGQPAWAGRDDMAASFRIGWDATNLYIAAKVRDNTYAQNSKGETLFKGDSLEILLDTKVSDDFYYDQLSPDDYQLGISAGRPDVNGTREAYLWLPANIAGTRGQVSIAATRSTADGITRIEAAIPWSLFGVTPRSGMHLGFAFSASDNDDPSRNVQQKMVSNVKTRDLTDPTTWGDLTLGN